MNFRRGLWPLVLLLLPLVMIMMGGEMTWASGEIYLTDGTSSDSILITTGVGTEFDLELRADENLLGFRLYIVHMNFDTTLLDTVFIHDTLSLFQELDTGFVLFGKYITDDDTILRVESQVFGAGITADGPGLLATMRFKAVGTGVLNMDFTYREVRDVANDTITGVTTDGVEIFINAPPDQFNLLTPASGQYYFLALEDSVEFDWEDALSPYGDAVNYRLEYSTDPAFPDLFTTAVNDISQSSVKIAAEDMEAGRIYWRIKAYNAYDTSYSYQQDWYIDVDIASYPESFSLISPADEDYVFVLYTENIAFEWEESITTNPGGDYVLYDMYYSTTPDFQTAETTILTGLSDTALVLPAADFVGIDRIYWKVKAYNTYGYVTWSTPTDNYFDLTVAANPAIFHLLSPSDAAVYNLNSGNGLHLTWTESVSDIPDDTITYTIYFGPNTSLPGSATFDTSVEDLYEIYIDESILPRRETHYWLVQATNKIGFDTLSAETWSFMTYYRGDADGNDLTNLLDITRVINYLYKSGDVPFPELAGDPNCDELVNLLDITFLINYLYKDGPTPCLD